MRRWVPYPYSEAGAVVTHTGRAWWYHTHGVLIHNGRIWMYQRGRPYYLEAGPLTQFIRRVLLARSIRNKFSRQVRRAADFRRGR